MTGEPDDGRARFAGRSVLVVGGGTGIGEAATRMFAAEGARIGMLDRDESAGQRVVDDLSREGCRALFIHGDLTDSEDSKAAIQATVDRFGRLDVLFVNAGGPAPDLARTLDLNLVAQARCVEQAVPHLRAAGGGTVVFTASLSGLIAHPGSAWYSASKAGLIGLARTLALELAGDRIRVNTVCPAGTLTPGLDGVWRAQGKDPQVEIARELRHKPLGRFCLPSDVAAAVLFLASDDASYITGVSLAIDGGEMLRSRI